MINFFQLKIKNRKKWHWKLLIRISYSSFLVVLNKLFAPLLTVAESYLKLIYNFAFGWRLWCCEWSEKTIEIFISMSLQCAHTRQKVHQVGVKVAILGLSYGLAEKAPGKRVDKKRSNRWRADVKKFNLELPRCLKVWNRMFGIVSPKFWILFQISTILSAGKTL